MGSYFRKGCPNQAGSPCSVGVQVDVRPEDALCDFAKMVFTDPS